MLHLHYKQLGDKNQQPLIILHGLFGMLDNWQSLAIRWSASYCVYTIDLRNHGRSPHSDKMDYYVMAEDVIRFCHHHHLNEVYILGHSMGGKVAMQTAMECPELILKLIIVDIAPKNYIGDSDVVLPAIASISLSEIASRKEAELQLMKIILDKAVVLFILKNLYRDEDGKYKWRMNFETIREDINEIKSNSLGPFVMYHGPTLFIKGGNSPHYIEAGDTSLLATYFSDFRIVSIEGAGHWVHADKPEIFYEVVSRFLKE